MSLSQITCSGGTTALRSQEAMIRKIAEFDMASYAKTICDPAPAGLGLWNMSRMAQACGANPDRVDQAEITRLIEDPAVAKGLPEAHRLDIRGLFWECVYAAAQENRHRFSIHRDEFLLPFNESERTGRRNGLKQALQQVIPHAYTGLLDPAHCIEDDFTTSSWQIGCCTT